MPKYHFHSMTFTPPELSTSVLPFEFRAKGCIKGIYWMPDGCTEDTVFDYDSTMTDEEWVKEWVIYIAGLRHSLYTAENGFRNMCRVRKISPPSEVRFRPSCSNRFYKTTKDEDNNIKPEDC